MLRTVRKIFQREVKNAGQVCKTEETAKNAGQAGQTEETAENAGQAGQTEETAKNTRRADETKRDETTRGETPDQQQNVPKHVLQAKYAYENSVFYRDYILQEKGGSYCPDNVIFEDLPVIEKEDIVNSRVPLLPIQYMLSPSDEQVITLVTSGSSGKMLNIEWNRSDYYRSMTQLWYLRKKYYHISPNDRLCFFYTLRQLGTEETMSYRRGNSIGFSKTALTRPRLREIYETMAEYRPAWLLMQPSMAELLLDAMEYYELPGIDSIRYIEFSGEMLGERLKKRVKETFHCDVANQYGSYEFNSIAYECPFGRMHVMHTNVYVENPEEKDGEGEFVITSLTNRRNPLIRYKIGDRGRLLNHVDCPCRNIHPVIELTAGRSYDFIDCADGSRISAYIFVRAIDNVNAVLEDVVVQFQVVQRNINDFLVRMYIDEFKKIPAIKEIFEENILEEALKDARYEYSFETEYLNDEQSGKLKYFRK